MKIIHSFLVVLVLMLGGIFSVSANWWGNPEPDIIICQWDECGFQEGADAAQNAIDGVVTDRTLSEYVIDIIQYLTTFFTLIGVIIVIYAGFTILVSWGDEEKIKKAKKLILYAILGLILVWLAWSITTFIISILDGTVGPAEGWDWEG